MIGKIMIGACAFILGGVGTASAQEQVIRVATYDSNGAQQGYAELTASNDMEKRAFDAAERRLKRDIEAGRKLNGACEQLMGIIGNFQKLLPEWVAKTVFVKLDSVTDVVCRGDDSGRTGTPDDQANFNAITRLGCVDHSPNAVIEDENGNQPADYCGD